MFPGESESGKHVIWYKRANHPPYPPGKVVITQKINKACFLTLVGLVKVNSNQISKN